MKISDEKLLDLIWKAQLNHTAKDVIHHYAGGSIGLCCDNDTWYRNSCDLHIVNRESITKKIGRQQLLLRIRRLAEHSEITVAMTTYKRGYNRDGWGDRDVLTYMIDGPEARAAFKDARKFWLDQGVPSRSKYLDDGRECMNTTKAVDMDSLLPECRKVLIDKYGDSRPDSSHQKASKIGNQKRAS